jgi:mycoredoxin
MLQHAVKFAGRSSLTQEFQESCNKDRNMNNLYTTAPAQLVMYATEYCSDRIRAKKFFQANNFSHLRVGLEGNTEATDFVMKVNNAYKSVPTMVFPDDSVLVAPAWEEPKTKFSSS